MSYRAYHDYDRDRDVITASRCLDVETASTHGTALLETVQIPRIVGIGGRCQHQRCRDSGMVGVTMFICPPVYAPPLNTHCTALQGN